MKILTKIYLSFIAVISAFVFTSQEVLGQGTPGPGVPPNPGEDPFIPIDFGLVYLIVAGIGLGVFMIWKTRYKTKAA